MYVTPGPPDVNLLEHLGTYAFPPPFSSSAVGRFLLPIPPAELPKGEAPACATNSPSALELLRGAGYSAGYKGSSTSAEKGSARFASKDSYRKLHTEAGLSFSKSAHGHEWPLLKRTNGELAYTQGWHRVDAVTRDYLSRTRLLRQKRADARERAQTVGRGGADPVEAA